MILQDHFLDSSFLPSWLPDETIFSLASRYHILNHNALSSTTARNLFGSHQAGSHHDFPAGIDHFERITFGQLGSAVEIINNHSILPFYLPFHPLCDQEAFVTTMQGTLIRSLKYRLGLLRSGIRAHHPLKACKQCMMEDIQNFGTAYWHRNHQLPGVWICIQHGCVLQEANVKANGVGRFLWYLPYPSLFPYFKNQNSKVIPAAVQILTSLAKMAEELVNLPAGFAFDICRLHTVYLQRLSSKHWLSPSGSLRLQSIIPIFTEQYAPLKGIGEFSSFLFSTRDAEKFLTGILRRTRSHFHPCKHLLLIHFLFTDWKTFLSEYQACQVNPSIPDLSSVQQQLPSQQLDSKHRQLIKLLAVQHTSMRQAAKALNIDFLTASNWAAQVGIPTKRRPKTLTQGLKTKIVTSLRDGLDKQTIAIQCQVSKQMVNRLLRTEPYLYITWKAAHQERIKQQWRQCLLTFINKHPDVSRKVLKQHLRAGFIWLYRHDKNWLYQQLPPKCPSQKTNYSHVPWPERDQQFAAAIRQIAVRLNHRYPSKKIPLWALFQALPDLKAKADQMAKLPETQRLIQHICGRTKT